MADTKRLEEKLEIISIDNSCHKNRKPLEEQILKLQDICIGEIIRRYGTLQKENKALLDTIDEKDKEIEKYRLVLKLQGAVLEELRNHLKN